ncbi:MAG: iron-containing alcohol dehydrogenase [Eubacteriales bacterium]|nr:iron-containing alcohol dehydrogenase [Eubacteriales bacterium]
MVGIIHAVGHALGGVCHVAHGDAMNILLPYGMKYDYDILIFVKKSMGNCCFLLQALKYMQRRKRKTGRRNPSEQF